MRWMHYDRIQQETVNRLRSFDAAAMEALVQQRIKQVDDIAAAQSSAAYRKLREQLLLSTALTRKCTSDPLLTSLDER